MIMKSSSEPVARDHVQHRRGQEAEAENEVEGVEHRLNSAHFGQRFARSGRGRRGTSKEIVCGTYKLAIRAYKIENDRGAAVI